MSTATAPTETAASLPARIGFSSLLLCTVLSTLVSLLVAGGSAVWVVRSGKLGTAPSATTAKAEIPVPSHVLALDPLIVNLMDGNGQSFLRAGVSLRIADEPKAKGEKAEEAKGDKVAAGPAAELRDTTLMVLSNQSADRLLAPGGRDLLKASLKDAFSKQNREVHVLDVYFTDFLVQRG